MASVFIASVLLLPYVLHTVRCSPVQPIFSVLAGEFSVGYVVVGHHAVDAVVFDCVGTDLGR